MSTDASLQQDLIEQTKSQIRTIIAEISQLSKVDMTPDQYHGEFLHRVVSAMGAVGGAVWTFEGGTLALAYQVNIKELGIPDQSDEAKQHARLLFRMLHSDDAGTLVPPHAGIVGDEQSGNPTPHLLVFCPIRTELEVVGLVEVMQRADTHPTAQRGFLRFLSQVCALATDYYKNRQLRHFGERQHLWTLLEDFTRTIHQSLDVTETTYTIVNEGRRLIECDRVSIALRSSGWGGGKCKVVAVSGQDTVDKRATTVRLLGNLASAVAKAGDPIWYTGDTADFAPQVEKAIDAYVDESHSKMIAVFPLYKKLKKSGGHIDPNEEAEQEQNPGRRKKLDKPFGAILIEQIEDSRVPERMRKRVEIVADHTCSALGNAIEHHSIFLMPIWKTIGKSKVLVSARLLPKTLLVSGAIFLVLLAMFFLPWKFQPHCTGSLEPVVRRYVFPPHDAIIKEVYVDHNSEVKGPHFDANGVERQGTMLVLLSSPELENRKSQLYGEGREIAQQIDSLSTRIRVLPRQHQDYENTLAQLTSELEQMKIRQWTNEQQRKLLEYQESDLSVTAPIDGTVVTWELKEKLSEKRPVTRMQQLMEIVNPNGDWQLELSMPEKRIGYIADYEQQMREKDPNFKLRVEFVLANEPQKKYFGTVADIHGRAEVRSDVGNAANSSSSLNTVLIKVTLDDPDALPPETKPGTECSAKVYCGMQPLGYVLFHEAFAFVRKQIIFRFF